MVVGHVLMRGERFSTESDSRSSIRAEERVTWKDRYLERKERMYEARRRHEASNLQESVHRMRGVSNRQAGVGSAAANMGSRGGLRRKSQAQHSTASQEMRGSTSAPSLPQVADQSVQSTLAKARWSTVAMAIEEQELRESPRPEADANSGADAADPKELLASTSSPSGSHVMLWDMAPVWWDRAREVRPVADNWDSRHDGLVATSNRVKDALQCHPADMELASRLLTGYKQVVRHRFIPPDLKPRSEFPSRAPSAFLQRKKEQPSPHGRFFGDGNGSGGGSDDDDFDADGGRNRRGWGRLRMWREDVKDAGGRWDDDLNDNLDFAGSGDGGYGSRRGWREGGGGNDAHDGGYGRGWRGDGDENDGAGNDGHGRGGSNSRHGPGDNGGGRRGRGQVDFDDGNGRGRGAHGSGRRRGGRHDGDDDGDGDGRGGGGDRDGQRRGRGAHSGDHGNNGSGDDDSSFGSRRRGRGDGSGDGDGDDFGEGDSFGNGRGRQGRRGQGDGGSGDDSDGRGGGHGGGRHSGGDFDGFGGDENGRRGSAIEAGDILAAIASKARRKSSRGAKGKRSSVFNKRGNSYVSSGRSNGLDGATAGGWQVKNLSAEELEATLNGSDGFDPSGSVTWAPRVAWCDAHALVDTEEVDRKRFENDWRRVNDDLGIGRAIKAASGGGGGRDREAQEETADPRVDQVQETLWKFRAACAVVFDFYAAVGASGGSGDLGFISLNVWNQFLIDFSIIDQKSKFLKQSDLDTLFISIDSAANRVQQQHLAAEEDARKNKAAMLKALSGSSGRQLSIAKIEARFEDKKQKFSRVEYLAALVKIAIKKYIDTKEMSDVSAAVTRLFEEDLIPRLRPAHAPPNNFRIAYLYVEPIEAVLRRRLTSLRSIFDGLASRHPLLRKHNLVSLPLWLSFLRAAKICGIDATERDASLCFAWSRMCVVTELTELGNLRQENLPFEGFLEALVTQAPRSEPRDIVALLCHSDYPRFARDVEQVRMAGLKSFPTDDEIAKAKAKDAAIWLVDFKMRSEDLYQAFLRERATAWGAERSALEPLHRSLDHLLDIILQCAPRLDHLVTGFVC